MTAQPLAFEWTGDAMVPIRAHRKRADAQFVVGLTYILDVHEQRSLAMHRGYFARIREAWMSFPEHVADDYSSPEALRKRALIKSGYAILTDFAAASSAEAARAAAAFTSADPYALVQIEDRSVRIWRAESQSMKAMGAKRFKESMEAVENWIAQIIGASVEDVRRAA